MACSRLFICNTMGLKLRLILLNFLQFAAWGAYLTSMGSYWAGAGFASQIWMFYGVQGVVSIFMPALMGIVADRWMSANRVLAMCHTVAGVLMLVLGQYLMLGQSLNFSVVFVLYSVSVAFYMPTLALANSVAYNAFELYGVDSVRHFPVIRVFGTVGFICAMLAVNFLHDASGAQFQQSYQQFLISGWVSVVLALYSLTLPASSYGRGTANDLVGALGLRAFSLFRQRGMALFFIFSMLLGAALQVTNGYANPFIAHFKDVPQFAHTWGAANANALISLSQLSEMLCILLIPFFMRKCGIKVVLLISMLAWVLRFGLFGLGDTGARLWMLVLSCVVYGIAFDFFNISGSLFVDKSTHPSIRSSAQGLFMLMTNGLGSTLGTIGAGWVVNHFVYQSASPNWSTAWLVFAGYAMAVAVLFLLLFRQVPAWTNKNDTVEQ